MVIIGKSFILTNYDPGRRNGNYPADASYICWGAAGM
jgi:hypothetical protein